MNIFKRKKPLTAQHFDSIVADVNKYLKNGCGDCHKCCDGSIFEQTALENGNHLHQPCEYLIDGTCSIYDHRPLACRNFPLIPIIVHAECSQAEEVVKVVQRSGW